MSALRLKTCTLGCKVNQYETEYVRQGLLGIGYRDAAAGEQADLCVVNTCTVTHESDGKSRQLIRRLARENPAAQIVVMGCYATRAPRELAALPGVAEVVTDKRELPALLRRLGVVDVPAGISRFGGRHRAYLKVQDGCLLHCSYCIIPHVRPHVLSRPLPDVVDEVRRLLDNGYRELVLTGVHLGHYGIDLARGTPDSAPQRLTQLVRHIAQLDGDFRLRLSSLEATEVTRELVETVAEFPDRICPHLHICLQSGSDRVLRRMQRRWAVHLFVARCRYVQERLPLPALTTDVIVGFPGEDAADFAATCDVVREIGFSKLHVFPYSPRQGTAAAGMPDQVPADIKAERVRQLTDIGTQLRETFFQRLIGQRLRVLVEAGAEGRADRCVGTSCRYVPVELSGGPQLAGQLVTCVPHAVTPRGLEA
jgi:threonylcarbamoyladenosine tRNA methylthiotransferase MtaB